MLPKIIYGYTFTCTQKYLPMLLTIHFGQFSTLDCKIMSILMRALPGICLSSQFERLPREVSHAFDVLCAYGFVNALVHAPKVYSTIFAPA